VKNGIIYEIYPRAFSQDGNFAGIERKLPELKKLGVTILWLMPIHPVGLEKRKGSLGSSYSVKDYYGINPEYGTLDDFKKLVSAAHAEGFKIIIDLVANHTAWDNPLAKKHTRWYTKNAIGEIISPVPDWTDVADLNYESKELRRYMIDMLKYWVKDIGIDGFRCDVAEMVPTDFWNEARTALDSIKPIVMLSEGQWPEHHIKAFDLTYGWNLYNTIKDIIDGKKTAVDLDSVLAQEARDYPKNSLRMRFSSNHDENAWDNPDVIRLGKEGAKLSAVLINTFPGVPLLYNGQEVGNDKKLGLFEKFEIDWNKGKEWREFYTTLYSIRKQNSALSEGAFKRIKNNNQTSVYSFMRSSGKNNVLVVLNFSKASRTVQLELPKELDGKTFINTFTEKKVDRKNVQKTELPAFGYRIFVVQ
jgi:glycosidase